MFFKHQNSYKTVRGTKTEYKNVKFEFVDTMIILKTKKQNWKKVCCLLGIPPGNGEKSRHSGFNFDIYLVVHWSEAQTNAQ